MRILCVLGRAARLLIHKEPIGKAVELLCTLIRTACNLFALPPRLRRVKKGSRLKALTKIGQ